eukprot:CAMPEP_0172321620 /NCGR_PEP_ID=MMETSP1058-20130122/43893_1 /TAXON_ID=83371 /ORGANISM="Detonula confervacea, Strain CCMP 353" /LENGTH=373 /DNA_ID=CAMNT_0013037179 /DNA_START=35 /DNA_END=1156 /DNA_ORIENTATION=-
MTVKGGVCVRHGAKKHKGCTHEGCTNIAKKGGVCVKHGAKVKKCSHEGCTNNSLKGGVCVRHGAKRAACSIDGCTTRVTVGGFCTRHGKQCSHEGCKNQALKAGLCRRHKHNTCSHAKCTSIVLGNTGVCGSHGKMLPNVEGSHQAKLRSGASVLVAMTAKTTSLSTPKSKLPTPKNNSFCTTPKIKTVKFPLKVGSRPATFSSHEIQTDHANATCTSTTQQQQRTTTTPKIKNLPTSKWNNIRNNNLHNPFAAAAAAEKIKVLVMDINNITIERDKLRSVVDTFKYKLQNAIEAENTSNKEKDAVISYLENRVQSLSKELELSKLQTQCAELKSKEMEIKMRIDTKEMDARHTEELNRLQKNSNETSDELDT